MFRNHLHIVLAIFLSSSLTDCLNLCNVDGLVKRNITSYIYRNEDIQFCECLDPSKCVRKCCAKGYNIEIKQCVFNGNKNFTVPLARYNETFTVLAPNTHSVGVLKHCNFYPRRPHIYVEDSFHLQEDLTLFLPEENVYLKPGSYCLDYLHEGYHYVAFVCIDESENAQADSELEEAAQKLKYAGMIISMPFLLVTFIVYALLPERNLHMKALMCYVFNLLFAYIFLVTIQLTNQVIEDALCATLGYGCIFFFLASFFWMNVICVDIFLGFRGFRGVPGVRSSERKRFLLYCAYAWGMSLLIVGFTFLFNHVGSPGDWYFPGVAVGQCFIMNGYPQLLFFYGPMGTVILFNVILFTLTALKIRQVKKDTAMLKHSESKRHSDDDQQNFNLYLKLLLAMGVNWTMELVSWAVNFNMKRVPDYVWYLSDFCNAIYGVVIFFIFVFKRNIWKQLKRRYYSFTGRHHLAHSMVTTNFTKTTNDSMTVSTTDRAVEESELTTRIR